MQRRLCFLVVGGLGAIVNLACFIGTYSSHLRITGTSAAYGMAFLAGTECPIVFNFMLNDCLTFGDLCHRSRQLRCLRYHVASTIGVLLTHGSSFALLHLLDVPAFFAQVLALLIATACNFTLHKVFTYSQGAVGAVSSSAPLRGPIRPSRAHAQKGCFYVIAS